MTTPPPTTTTAATGSAYQQLRGHLHYLRLDAAAEALPATLDQAAADKLSHTAFLERLLAIEVHATEARRQASRLPHCPFPYHRSPRHHSRPSRSRRGWRAGSCGWRSGTAGGAGPPDGYRQRAPRPTTAAANQLRPTAGSNRRSPPRAAKGRRAWSCVLPRTVGCAHVASPGSEVALGPAARTR